MSDAEKTAEDEARLLGKRIAALRDKAGLDNEGLAALMGLSVSSINAWVSGQSLANFLKLKRLAEVLGVTPNDVLGVSGASGRDSPAGSQDARSALFAAIDQSLLSLGLREEEAEVLSEIALKAISTPSLPGIRDRDAAIRAVVAYEANKFLRSKAK